MMIHHGMALDAFFGQDLSLFLEAQAAMNEEEIVYIDDIEG